MHQAVLADAKFHEQLLVFDRDLATSARTARCWRCGGAPHSASYDRKPRGGLAGLGTDSPFASVAMAAVAPPIDIAALPVSLLDRFAGDAREKLIALLRFLGPLTGGASAMRAL